MNFDSLAPQVITRLSQDLGITQDQAAGVVGQLGFESEGLQAINERAPVVPGSRGGFGWAQWTGPRRRDFESWASSNKMDINTPEANYGFLVHELKNTPESRVLDKIRSAGDAQMAGRAFTDGFLRPGIPAYDKRASWTDKALNFIMPTAQAGTVDEWEALEKQFSPGAQQESPEADDPWADLEKRFAAPAINEPISSAVPPEAIQQPVPQGDSGGYLKQIGSGLLEGVTGALGAPIDLTNSAIGLGMSGVNSLFGTDFQPSQNPLGGSRGLRQGLPIAPPSDDMGPQMARRVAQSVGGAAIPVASGARTGQQIAAGLGVAAGGGVGGAIAQQAFPGNIPAEVIGEALGSIGTGAAISGLANRSARRAAEKAVPTVEQLKKDAAGKFDEAHKLGISADQQQTHKLAGDIRGIAQSEGLISPTGRVSEAYPKAREALRMLDDYSQGPMSVPQMQTVRKVLADAAGSTDKAERRIATLMLNQFDDFTAPLAPQLAEARGLYSRAMRGDQLDTLRELAGARAGQFTGSGFENALRTEYRGLDRRIAKGQERGWTPDQIEAINRVSRGTGTSNTARNVGRMAPTGPVSFMSTAGVPAIIGTTLGGPLLGAGLATGSSMVGYGARDLATRYGLRHADLAEMLARSGGAIPVGNNPNLWPQMLGAALGAQTAIDR